MTKKLLCLLLSLSLSLPSFTANSLDISMEEPPKRPDEITTLDISIIPKSRPKTCGLVGSKYAEILAEIQAVSQQYNTECISQAENIIKNINQEMTNLETAHGEYLEEKDQAQEKLDEEEIADSDDDSASEDSSDSDNDIGPSLETPIARITGDQAKQIQQTLTGLGALVSKKQCREEFEEKGIMPIITSTIQSISNIALLVPSSQSIAIGLTGSLITTLIDVFREMVKPDFQWANNEDRDAFLRFNCAYNNVVMKIEKEGVYQIKDEKLEKQIANLKKEIAELEKQKAENFPLHQKIIDLRKEKQTELSELKVQREEAIRTYVMEEESVTKYDRYLKDLSEVTSALEGLASVTDNFLVEKAKVFTALREKNESLFKNKEDVKPLDGYMYFSFVYDASIVSIQKLDPMNVGVLMSMTKESLNSLVADLKESHNNLSLMHSEIFAAERALLTPEMIDNIISDVQTDTQLEERYQRIVTSVETDDAYQVETETIGQVSDDINIKKRKLARLEKQYRPYGEEMFSVDNSPSNNAKSIRDLDELNANRIYGPTGYSLIRFLVEESQEAIDDYNNNIEKMIEGMPVQEFRLINDDRDKLTYCTNINRMRKVYANSNFPTELAYDFAVTNLPLFHNLYEKSFILTDERKELRSQVFSALYAKALIDKFNDPEDRQIETIDDLVLAADSLEYPEKIKICTKVKNKSHRWDRDNKHKNKYKCEQGHPKTLIESSVGKEMIKLMVIKEDALKLQRKFNEYCGFLTLQSEDEPAEAAQ